MLAAWHSARLARAYREDGAPATIRANSSFQLSGIKTSWHTKCANSSFLGPRHHGILKCANSSFLGSRHHGILKCANSPFETPL